MRTRMCFKTKQGTEKKLTGDIHLTTLNGGRQNERLQMPTALATYKDSHPPHIWHMPLPRIPPTTKAMARAKFPAHQIYL